MNLMSIRLLKIENTGFLRLFSRLNFNLLMSLFLLVQSHLLMSNSIFKTKVFQFDCKLWKLVTKTIFKPPKSVFTVPK